jgi:Ca2+-binding RTX toxin-like protein
VVPHRPTAPIRRALLLAGVTALLAVPASASASTTLGSDLSQQPNAAFSCLLLGSCTTAQTALPGHTLTATGDGVVVRWRVRAEPLAGATLRLRVLRPSGGGYLGAGATGYQSVDSGISTFNTQLPVQAGDRIGFDGNFSSLDRAWRYPVDGATSQRWDPILGQGSLALGLTGPPAELLANADIEADIDDDGLGDETQDDDIDNDGVLNPDDQCPTVPGPAPSGCPDTDGDGVPDLTDHCPTVPGPAPSGCPPSTGGPGNGGNGGNGSDGSNGVAGAFAAGCGATDRTVPGGAGDDVLTGSLRRDAIFGWGGSDTIRGLSAGDCLRGGAGPDILLPGAGADVALGGPDVDSLAGGRGRDRLGGGGGNDRIGGGAQRDRLRGGAGTDTILGGRGNDRINGGPGNDLLRGGPGRDVIRCGAGFDVVRVGPGDRIARDCEVAR